MKKKLIALILCLALALASLAAIPAPGIDTDESSVMFDVAEEITEEDNPADFPEQTDSPSEEAQALYESLMACQTYEEACVLVDDLGADNVIALLDELTEEQRQEIEDHIQTLYTAYLDTQDPEDDTPPAVNYAVVASFRELVTAAPVLRSSSRRLMSAQSASGTDGLVLDKSASANEDGSYTITIEAYTTGRITAGEAKPCDIILVFDQSTSMKESFSETSYNAVYELDKSQTYYVLNNSRYRAVTYCTTCNAWTYNCYTVVSYHNSGTKYTPKTSADDSSGTQFYERIGAMTRFEAANAAANAFVDTVIEMGTDSRIAVVSFEDGVNLWTGTADNNALLNASENETAIRSAIDNATSTNYADYATEHGKGLEKAVSIFDANDSTGRQRIVIMLTDGEPEPKSSGDWSARIVKQAIDNSYSLKNTYSAAVYCISVMPGSNAENPTSDMDKYISYVSSNYPNAQYTGTYNGTNSASIIAAITPGEKADISNGSFYLTAGDISTLSSIFTQIAAQTGGSSITLGSSAEIRDVVTQYFNMPSDASKVAVQTVDCLSYDSDTGAATWSETGTPLENAVTVSENTISVVGFDFDRNFVASTGRVEGDVSQTGDFYGRKVVISFTVTPKETFLGGNNVPTNGTASGIYTGNAEIDPIETFPVPTANVPIKDITVTATDKNVYLTGGLTETDMVNGAGASVGSVALNLNADNYGLQTWQNEFVNISVTAGGSQTAYMTDGTYSVSVTVSPSEALESSVGTPAGAKTGTATANINVFLPTVGFSDDTAYYGDAVPDLTDNAGTVTWKHNGTDSSAVTMIGTAPDITYTYAPGDGVTDGKIAVKTDIPVDVTAKIGDTDITTYATFTHIKCSEVETIPENAEFVIHVRTCQLTVTKSGGDESETYIFTVMKDNAVYTSVTITGNNSVTIVELPVGAFTIEEDTGWSWRYKATIDGPATLSKDSPSGTITCTNDKTNDSWLNGFSAVVKNIFGVAKTN